MFSDIARLGGVAYVEDQRSRPAVWGFSHVPKTAGTSLTAALAAGRPPYYNIFVKDYSAVGPAFHEQEWAVVKEFVEIQKAAKPDARCRSFSGHLRRPHLDFIRNELPDVRTFTLLRDPVERIISHYRYCVTPKHPAHERFARQYPTIRDFAAHPTSQDIMVRFLAPNPRADARTAVEAIVSGMDFIGVMELYEMSISMILRMMGVVQLPIEHLNQTVDIDRNVIEIDADTREELRKINARDEALYRTVRDMLEPQVQSWWRHVVELGNIASV